MKAFTIKQSFWLILLAAFQVTEVRADELKLTAGPYLMAFSQTSMTIMWETNQPASSLVEYGEEAPLTGKALKDGLSTIHEIVLEGLAPETAYYYQVFSETANEKCRSGVFTFQTAVNKDTPYAYCVMGDNRTYPETFTRIADLAYAERPNFVIHVGDVVSNGNVKEQWITEFLYPARNLMARVPTYIAIGNHEENAHWYYDYVSYPTPENNYSFDFGNAHFTMVDSTQDLKPGGKLYDWIDNDLAGSNALWKFVVHHHPPYSSDENDYGDTIEKHQKTARGDVDMRPVTAIYEKHGVDVVWCGHIHDYERTWPIRDGKVDPENGVIYVQSGGGGAELENFTPTRSWFTAKVLRGYQYCYVTVQGGSLRMMAYDIDGKMYDYFDLKK